MEKLKLKLLTDSDRLLMVVRIYHVIQWYTEASNKYMKHYDDKKGITTSYVLGCEWFVGMDNVTKVTYSQL